MRTMGVWHTNRIQYTSSYLGDPLDIHRLLLAPRSVRNCCQSKQIFHKDGIIRKYGYWHPFGPLPLQRFPSWRKKVWEVAVSRSYSHKLSTVGSNYADSGKVSWIRQIHHHVQVSLSSMFKMHCDKTSLNRAWLLLLYSLILLSLLCHAYAYTQALPEAFSQALYLNLSQALSSSLKLFLMLS